jgi:L-amino acid N-acyltransferase YncA
MIRSVSIEDAGAICAIYNPYVVGATITFEEQEVPVETMRARIADSTVALPWLVLEAEGELGGYAYATRWRVRAAYRYSVETTIYLAPRFQRRGFGMKLYGELIEKLRGLGIHRAMGGIALPNAGSVALHERMGFRKVALFEEVGWKFDRWIDVGYWQLNL